MAPSETGARPELPRDAPRPDPTALAWAHTAAHYQQTQPPPPGSTQWLDDLHQLPPDPAET